MNAITYHHHYHHYCCTVASAARGDRVDEDDDDDDDDDDVGRLAEGDVIIRDSTSTSMEDGVRHFIKLSSLIFSPRLRLPPSPRSSSL